MSKHKTWIDLHENERFGDGGILESCKQCEECIFKEANYRTGCCRIYEYPENKPNEIMRNEEDCEYFEKAV